jgi:PIN domain nuclease of toxin-antitoxin system
VKVLLDTHTFLWFLAGSPRVRAGTRDLVLDGRNEVFVSAASAWEISIKRQLGKLRVPPGVATWLPHQLAANRFTPLSITLEHAAAVEELPPHHRDPFDRLLIAQALAEGLAIVSDDAQFTPYAVRVIPC